MYLKYSIIYYRIVHLQLFIEVVVHFFRTFVMLTSMQDSDDSPLILLFLFVYICFVHLAAYVATEGMTFYVY